MRMVNIKKNTDNIPSVGESVEELELQQTVSGKAKWCKHFGKEFLSYKSKCILDYESAILLLEN